MTDYHRWKSRLIGEALDREEIDGIDEPRVHSSAKYKKDRHETETEPDLKVGKMLVVEVGANRSKRRAKGEKHGYLHCIVLDWQRYDGFWTRRTDVICQVMATSNPTVAGLDRRLIVATKDGGWFTQNRIVAFDRDFSKWLPSG